MWGFRNLDRTVEHWDDVLVFLVAQKLHTTTRRAREHKLDDTAEYPRYRELDRVLESCIRALDMMTAASSKGKSQTKGKTKRKALPSHAAITNHSAYMSALQDEPSVIWMFYVPTANSIPTLRFYYKAETLFKLLQCEAFRRIVRISAYVDNLVNVTIYLQFNQSAQPVEPE